MLTPLLHSFIVAISATIFAFLLMLPLAAAGAFTHYRAKILVEILLLLPLVLPPTIVGFYLLSIFGKYGPLSFFGNAIIFSLNGAIIATTVIIFPLVYQGLKAAFLSVPREMIEEARLNANSLQILFYILLPVSSPMLAATLFLSFGRALGEFGASLMVAGYIPGQTDTLSNAIYFAVQNGNNTQALQLSLINIFLGVLLLLVIVLLNRKSVNLHNHF